jgi:hypothetical protein
MSLNHRAFRHGLIMHVEAGSLRAPHGAYRDWDVVSAVLAQVLRRLWVVIEPTHWTLFERLHLHPRFIDRYGTAMGWIA